MPRLRYTSGGKEGELLSRAKELRKDPELLLPRLTNDCPERPFDKIREALKEVQAAKDDAALLQKLSGRGENLARAYAGLLYFAEERPTSSMVVARYPTGDIPYMPLGSAPKEEQIAVQYYDDPRRLLLGYLRLARGGFLAGAGLHFYALEDGIVCTGREAAPPQEFVKASLERLPYRLSPSGNKALVCAHLARGELEPSLSIHWRSANRTLKVCRRCAKEDAHLISSLSENMAIPDAEGDFEVQAVYPLEHKHAETCPLKELPTLSSSEEKRYRSGRVSDGEFLGSYAKQVEDGLAGLREPVLVAGGRCFNRDVAALIEALNPTPAEKRALKAVLPEVHGPLIVADLSAGKVLEILWKDWATELLGAVGATDDEAARAQAEFQSAPGRVSELLGRLYRHHQETTILAKLPRYRRLNSEAALADQLARLYRIQGGAAVERKIVADNPPEGKIRGVAWAFLLALGRTQGQAWRFSETEQEFGASLQSAAKTLLDADPADYHKALDALLTLAGSPSWGERADE